MTEAPRWFTRLPGASSPRLRLFLFPYAGSGSGAFRRWRSALPPDVEMWLVNLPGRDARHGERMPTRMADLMQAMAPPFAALPAAPTAFFGHSMGALLAFELARQLRRSGAALPAKILVSGYPAPHLPPTSPPLHGLPEAELVRELTERGGISPALVSNPDLLDLVLPTLRRDMELCETYSWREEAPLPCDLVAFTGDRDPDVGPDELQAWGRHTAGRFSSHVFPGDHFFLQEQEPAFLASMVAALR